MSMKTGYKLIALLLTGLLLVTGLAGCGQVSVQGDGDDSAPFYKDRVVTIYLVMDEEDWEYMQQNAINEEYARADMWYDGELITDVAVRPKGSSSLASAVQGRSIRFSLKVDINFFNSFRTLYGVKKINLNNGWSDPTFMREVLAYEIFEEMGVPTPRTSFVDVWVNDTHMGLYTMVEQIDKTFLGNNFEDDTGNLYKPELPLAYLNWTSDTLEGYLEEDADLDELNLGGGKWQEIMDVLEQAEEEEEEDLPAGAGRPGNLLWDVVSSSQGDTLIDQMGLKTNENNPDHSALFNLVDILNTEPDETFVEEIEKVLDADEFLRFLAVSAAIVHLDNYIGMGHNYYLYEIDGKFTVIPWDLNMAFGTYSPGMDRDTIIDFYIDEPTMRAVATYALVDRLLAVPDYLETYHAYLEEIIEGPFSPEAMSARIDELAELIRPYVEADELKFYSTEEFEIALGNDILPADWKGLGMNPLGLGTFVIERVASIWQQLDGELPSTSGDGSGNQPTEAVFPGRVGR